MAVPRRLKRLAGRHALVDGIPFRLPVASERSPALMAVFPVDAERAQRLIPGSEIHVLRFRGKALLMVTVIDYRHTNIGRYVEYSIALACTRGPRSVPLAVAGLFSKRCGTGQYVLDLPVSSLISVKGGRGIWGMPKHQANLDFVITPETVSSRYDLDGRMVMRIEVQNPGKAPLPLRASAVNWCSFRGLLCKSYINFSGRLGFRLFKKGSARIDFGDHPRAHALAALNPGDPIFAGFFPETSGVLDDHFECWFESFAHPPADPPAGMETVMNLPLSEEWLPPPGSEEAARQAREKVRLGVTEIVGGEVAALPPG